MIRKFLKCPNCQYQNNDVEVEVCDNCGLPFPKWNLETPQPPAPKPENLVVHSPMKKEELEKELEKKSELEISEGKKNLEVPSPNKLLGAAPDTGEIPSKGDKTWDDFLEKLPLGKTRLGQIMKPILVGSTKPVGPTLQKFLGQRWGGWSVITALVASLSGLVYGNIGDQPSKGAGSNNKDVSMETGIIRVEGKLRPKEKILVEKEQLNAKPDRVGAQKISGTWPSKPCLLRPVISGKSQIDVQQPTAENPDAFTFQIEGKKVEKEALKTVYFLWDCTEKQ